MALGCLLLTCTIDTLISSCFIQYDHRNPSDLCVEYYELLKVEGVTGLMCCCSLEDSQHTSSVAVASFAKSLHVEDRDAAARAIFCWLRKLYNVDLDTMPNAWWCGMHKPLLRLIKVADEFHRLRADKDSDDFATILNTLRRRFES